jgi:hypothetical protein
MILWKNTPENERSPTVPKILMGLNGQSYQKLAVKWDFSTIEHYSLAGFLLIETVV